MDAYMLSDSSTELPKMTKHPVPIGLETKTGGLAASPAPSLSADLERQMARIRYHSDALVWLGDGRLWCRGKMVKPPPSLTGREAG